MEQIYHTVYPGRAHHGHPMFGKEHQFFLLKKTEHESQDP